MSKRQPIVVLAPDVIIRGFVASDFREVLIHWRDGAIIPAVTRELLVYYLKALRVAGIPDSQLRRWAIWFTAREKTRFMAQPGDPGMSLRATLLDAALRCDATCIISGGASIESPGSPLPWMSVAEFLGGERS
ncbi:MAG: hypothetical protein KF886_02170 [Candidatus Hydrogenedentes bacterium]|nr:hypothetical protein [Candidatus Hydrogenedentota bacterium]